MTRCFVLFCLVLSPVVAAHEPGEFRVAGYLPDYRFADLRLDKLRGLTDLIIFSVEPEANGTLNRNRLRKCPWQQLLTFKTRNRVRLVLTIGGWNRSTNFPTIAKSPALRRTFAANVAKFAMEKRLDGIDIDWEHPKDAAEVQAYGDLLGELQSVLKPRGIMLSVTIAAWQTLPAKAVESVDTVQVMAYDHKGKHSTLQGATQDVRTLIAGGIAANKLVLGVPFYGRRVQTREAVTYASIVQQHSPNEDIDQVGDVYFNGPRTVRSKVEFAVESGLAGVMVWELGQDTAGDRSLLSTIHHTIAKTRRTK